MDSAYSPALSTPIRFRTSGVAECVHSECFLLPYDLHRLYADVPGRPRILINPQVKVAYNLPRYNWQNYILELPLFKWWRSELAGDRWELMLTAQTYGAMASTSPYQTEPWKLSKADGTDARGQP